MGRWHQRFLKQIHEEKKKDEPIERKTQNNNNWINTAKDWGKWARLEEKYTMFCAKWQKKKRKDEDLENKAAAAQRSRALWWWKQQQHSGHEYCEGGKQWSRSKWRVLNKMEESTNEFCSYQRTKVGSYSRYDCCTVVSCRPPSWCFRFSWSPGLPLPASWLPAFFLFCLWCCSESEDSMTNLRIQHSNCLWPLFWFSSYMYIESISGLVAIHSVHKQFIPAHLPNERVTTVKQILFVGSLSVSLSLSLSWRGGTHWNSRSIRRKEDAHCGKKPWDNMPLRREGEATPRLNAADLKRAAAAFNQAQELGRTAFIRTEPQDLTDSFCERIVAILEKGGSG